MENFILPLSIILVSAICAVIIKRYFLPKFQNWASQTKWYADDILAMVLNKSLVLWMMLGGAYLSFLYTPFSQNEKMLFEKVLLIVFVISIAVSLSTMVVSFFKITARIKTENLPTTSIFINFLRIVIFVLAVLVILESFGISIIPFLTALGIGGFAVALALQDTLSNFFSGFYMLVSHNFKPRDYVEIEGGEKGYIQDINWRNTTILTLSNNLLIIPNSKIASSVIKNYSRPEQELAVLVEMKISYLSNLKETEKIVEAVGANIMQEVPGGVEDFKPFIRYHAFADSGVGFTVVLRAKKFVDQYLITHEFVKAIHEEFQKNGIEIAFPQFQLHLDNAEKNKQLNPQHLISKISIKQL